MNFTNMDLTAKLKELDERRQFLTKQIDDSKEELNKINLQARKLTRILKDAEEVLSPGEHEPVGEEDSGYYPQPSEGR